MGDKSTGEGGPPPPSPLTGAYLLVVLPQTHQPQHKDNVLHNLTKGLLTWDKNDCHVDLEKELQTITAQAPEGEEAKNGERLIQFASENLVTEVLIHPQLNTLVQCLRNLLSSFTRHRHIIHAGYTCAGNGAWMLQDGTYSFADFAEMYQEHEVQRVLRAYENTVAVDVHCLQEGDWNNLRGKDPFSKISRVRLNPKDCMSSGPALHGFLNYLSPYITNGSIEELLESSDVVGNIRFSHPTLYVFPGGQGDAALFGINGFNILVDGGFARRACFWDFSRHLDRLDAVLMTRLNNGNVQGMTSLLRRKRMDNVYPQIGHFFCNLQDRKHPLSPDGDKDKDPLLISLFDQGHDILASLKHLSLKPQSCYRDPVLEPINLYHKVGHGKLDMYVISPAKDSREVREFLAKWSSQDSKIFCSFTRRGGEFNFPLSNKVSICALLVWQPANPEDNITRLLFPGSTPQHKIFEGLDKLRNLEFMKHAVCSARTLSPSSSSVGLNVRTLSKPKVPASVDKIIENDEKKTEAVKQPIVKPPTGQADRQILKSQPPQPRPPSKPKSVEKPKEKPKTETEVKSEKPETVKTDKPKLDKIEKIEAVQKTDKPKEKPKRPITKQPEKKKPLGGEKKDEKKDSLKSSPTTPKKVPENRISEAQPKPEVKSRASSKTKPSPSATPAKSAKEANNRKVFEQKKEATKKIPSKREDVKKTEKPPAPKKSVPSPSKVDKQQLSPVKAIRPIKPKQKIEKQTKAEKDGVTESVVSTPSTGDVELSKAKEDSAEREIKSEEKVEVIDEPAEPPSLSKDEEDEILVVEKIEIEGTGQDKPEESIAVHIRSSREDIVEKDDEEIKQEVPSEQVTDDKKEIMKTSDITILDTDSKQLSEDVQDLTRDAMDNSKSKVEFAPTEEASITKTPITDKLTPKDKDGKEKSADINEVKIADESQPDEKFSTTVESGATTAPTLPEDERIPLDEIKEGIEEKHVNEETKEKESGTAQRPEQPTSLPEVAPVVPGLPFDQRVHLLKDIVKTPDEVADLPVHEEADGGIFGVENAQMTRDIQKNKDDLLGLPSKKSAAKKDDAAEEIKLMKDEHEKEDAMKDLKEDNEEMGATVEEREQIEDKQRVDDEKVKGALEEARKEDKLAETAGTAADEGLIDNALTENQLSAMVIPTSGQEEEEILDEEKDKETEKENLLLKGRRSDDDAEELGEKADKEKIDKKADAGAKTEIGEIKAHESDVKGETNDAVEVEKVGNVDADQSKQSPIKDKHPEEKFDDSINTSEVNELDLVQDQKEEKKLSKTPSPDLQIADVKQTEEAAKLAKSPTHDVLLESQLSPTDRNKAQSLEPQAEFTKSPSPEIPAEPSASTGVQAKASETPSPEVPAEPSVSPGAQVKASKSPSPEVLAEPSVSPGAQAKASKSPSPEVPAEPPVSPGAQAKASKSPSPEVPAEPSVSPGAQAKAFKSSSPDVPAEPPVSPGAQAKASKSPSPEVPAEPSVSPGAQAKASKSSSPDVPAEPPVSPGAQAKASKSPSPEVPVERSTSPGGQAKASKSPSPEVPAERFVSPGTQAKASKSPSPEVPDERSVSPGTQTKASKSQSPEVPAERPESPGTQATVSKSPSPEVPAEQSVSPGVQTKTFKTSSPDIQAEQTESPAIQDKGAKLPTPEAKAEICTSPEMQSQVAESLLTEVLTEKPGSPEIRTEDRKSLLPEEPVKQPRSPGDRDEVTILPSREIANEKPGSPDIKDALTTSPLPGLPTEKSVTPGVSPLKPSSPEALAPSEKLPSPLVTGEKNESPQVQGKLSKPVSPELDTEKSDLHEVQATLTKSLTPEALVDKFEPLEISAKMSKSPSPDLSAHGLATTVAPDHISKSPSPDIPAFQPEPVEMSGKLPSSLTSEPKHDDSKEASAKHSIVTSPEPISKIVEPSLLSSKLESKDQQFFDQNVSKFFVSELEQFNESSKSPELSKSPKSPSLVPADYEKLEESSAIDSKPSSPDVIHAVSVEPQTQTLDAFIEHAPHESTQLQSESDFKTFEQPKTSPLEPEMRSEKSQDSLKKSPEPAVNGTMIKSSTLVDGAETVKSTSELASQLKSSKSPGGKTSPVDAIESKREIDDHQQPLIADSKKGESPELQIKTSGFLTESGKDEMMDEETAAQSQATHTETKREIPEVKQELQESIIDHIYKSPEASTDDSKISMDKDDGTTLLKTQTCDGKPSQLTSLTSDTEQVKTLESQVAKVDHISHSETRDDSADQLSKSPEVIQPELVKSDAGISKTPSPDFKAELKVSSDEMAVSQVSQVELEADHVSPKKTPSLISKSPSPDLETERPKSSDLKSEETQPFGLSGTKSPELKSYLAKSPEPLAKVSPPVSPDLPLLKSISPGASVKECKSSSPLPEALIAKSKSPTPEPTTDDLKSLDISQKSSKSCSPEPTRKESFPEMATEAISAEKVASFTTTPEPPAVTSKSPSPKHQLEKSVSGRTDQTEKVDCLVSEIDNKTVSQAVDLSKTEETSVLKTLAEIGDLDGKDTHPKSETPDHSDLSAEKKEDVKKGDESETTTEKPRSKASEAEDESLITSVEGGKSVEGKIYSRDEEVKVPKPEVEDKIGAVEGKGLIPAELSEIPQDMKTHGTRDDKVPTISLREASLELSYEDSASKEVTKSEVEVIKEQTHGKDYQEFRSPGKGVLSDTADQADWKTTPELVEAVLIKSKADKDEQTEGLPQHTQEVDEVAKKTTENSKIAKIEEVTEFVTDSKVDVPSLDSAKVDSPLATVAATDASQLNSDDAISPKPSPSLSPVPANDESTHDASIKEQTTTIAVKKDESKSLTEPAGPFLSLDTSSIEDPVERCSISLAESGTETIDIDTGSIKDSKSKPVVVESPKTVTTTVDDKLGNETLPSKSPSPTVDLSLKESDKDAHSMMKLEGSVESEIQESKKHTIDDSSKTASKSPSPTPSRTMGPSRLDEVVTHSVTDETKGDKEGDLSTKEGDSAAAGTLMEDERGTSGDVSRDQEEKENESLFQKERSLPQAVGKETEPESSVKHELNDTKSHKTEKDHHLSLSSDEMSIDKPSTGEVSEASVQDAQANGGGEMIKNVAQLEEQEKITIDEHSKDSDDGAADKTKSAKADGSSTDIRSDTSSPSKTDTTVVEISGKINNLPSSIDTVKGFGSIKDETSISVDKPPTTALPNEEQESSKSSIKKSSIEEQVHFALTTSDPKPSLESIEPLLISESKTVTLIPKTDSDEGIALTTTMTKIEEPIAEPPPAFDVTSTLKGSTESSHEILEKQLKSDQLDMKGSIDDVSSDLNIDPKKIETRVTDILDTAERIVSSLNGLKSISDEMNDYTPSFSDTRSFAMTVEGKKEPSDKITEDTIQSSGKIKEDIKVTSVSALEFKSDQLDGSHELPKSQVITSDVDAPISAESKISETTSSSVTVEKKEEASQDEGKMDVKTEIKLISSIDETNAVTDPSKNGSKTPEKLNELLEYSVTSLTSSAVGPTKMSSPESVKKLSTASPEPTTAGPVLIEEHGISKASVLEVTESFLSIESGVSQGSDKSADLSASSLKSGEKQSDTLNKKSSLSSTNVEPPTDRDLPPISSATASLKAQKEFSRSETPASDILSDREVEIGHCTPRSDISSGQVSRVVTHVWETLEGRPESQHYESDDDLPGSPMSISSHIPSPPQFEYDMTRGQDQLMMSSFYGALPSDLDDGIKSFTGDLGSVYESGSFEEDNLRKELAVDKLSIGVLSESSQRSTPESSPLPDRRFQSPISKESSSSTPPTVPAPSSSTTEAPKDPIAKWDKPLGLPPPHSTDSSTPILTWNPYRAWGKPLGLPSPAPPPPENTDTEVDTSGGSAKTTPKKVSKMNADSNKYSSTIKENKGKRSESPVKRPSGKDRKSGQSPVYMDLSYVPHHGNSNYATVEFFKRVRARYYVFSGTEPSKEVFNALLEAKQSWDDKDLEVTIIPTYDTDTLGYWIAENEETLTKLKIDLSPSASRCTINLQDHDTSCSAYRLEF